MQLSAGTGRTNRDLAKHRPSVGQVPATAIQWSTFVVGFEFVPLGDGGFSHGIRKHDKDDRDDDDHDDRR
jgi:hypothetical protein